MLGYDCRLFADVAVVIVGSVFLAMVVLHTVRFLYFRFFVLGTERQLSAIGGSRSVWLQASFVVSAPKHTQSKALRSRRLKVVRIQRCVSMFRA